MVEAVDGERQWMEHQPQEGCELVGMDVERDVGGGEVVGFDADFDEGAIRSDSGLSKRLDPRDGGRLGELRFWIVCRLIQS